MIDEDTEKSLARLVVLTSPRLGTTVDAASDEFFGAKERLIQDADPVFIPGHYDDNGKWVDGWETRRRRGLGHDWCLVRLGVVATLDYVELDTRHFTGNYAPSATVEGCADEDTPTAESEWSVVLPAAALGPDQRHVFPVSHGRPVRWLRLSIFPDGGVARLRAYGRPALGFRVRNAAEVELSSIRHGGRVLGYSDAHYGNPWVILTDGRGRDMGDGWETRRRREPGHDWMVIALGVPGIVGRVEIDTAHYKGNYPDRVSLQACLATHAADDVIVCQSMFWPELLAPHHARADDIHHFGGAEIAALGPISHIKINIHPDGGISRFRAFGRPSR